MTHLDSSADKPSDILLVAAPSPSRTTATPSFVNASIRLSRGLAIVQIKAVLPNTREIDILATESSEGKGGVAAPLAFAGEILAPYANRIAGELSPNGETVRVELRDRSQGGRSTVRVVALPALKPKDGGAPHKFAMHGLLTEVSGTVVRSRTERRVDALLHAGDFGGRWPSSIDIAFTAEISATAFDFSVTASNVGKERTPIGLGWHPYFAFPSGERTGARMHLPSTKRLAVGNYRDVLPTGDVLPAEGECYDFSRVGGESLAPALFLDECYVGLEKTPEGNTVAQIVDDEASYGLRIIATSPEVSAIQAYTTPGKPFIALEPQFNWTDPFGSEWPEGIDTGMVWLAPRDSVTYAVRLELFTP
jgi:aldose 1-epimerase